MKVFIKTQHIKKYENVFLYFLRGILFIGVLSICFLASDVKAANVGDVINFNVDENYDVSARSQVQAILIQTTLNLSFYIEKNWWDLQVPAKKVEILTSLDNLSSEFSNKIYPTLTSVYGSEWKPGVDGDTKITILFQSMKENFGGYFRSSDGYIKLQIPDSNEREMLYLPIAEINGTKLKIFLAHEFVHLIIFNQKDRLQGVQEEVWLNEARAEYASQILGYNDSYGGSNLESRVKDFLARPSDSLTEWRDAKYDYGTVNAFIYYLIDHYGINILSDSLKSKLIGISSINEILLKNGYKESFSEIFTNWTIAVAINDCSLDFKYCYLNKNLKSLIINSTINFLPLSGNSSLSVTNVTKNWSGNWQKIIGGNGDLKLEFSSSAGLDFQIPYITFDKNNNSSVNFLKLDANEKGEINIKNFSDKYNSLIIIPSLQTKFSGFNGFEFTYPYTFAVSIAGAEKEEDQAIVQKLLAQIDSLKKQIAALQPQVNNQQGQNLCYTLQNNLYVGLSYNSEVSCLQQFLKNQGPEIYPEGLITGNFGILTKSAVINFQKKYNIAQTGFVGILTRAKINQLLNNISNVR